MCDKKRKSLAENSVRELCTENTPRCEMSGGWKPEDDSVLALCKRQSYPG